MTWGWVGKTAHQRILQGKWLSGDGALRLQLFCKKQYLCLVCQKYFLPSNPQQGILFYFHSLLPFLPQSHFLFSICVCGKKNVRVCACVLSGSIMSDFATLWTATHQAPLSMGFPRQEHWTGLPFPLPGDLPNPGIDQTHVPCIACGFFTTEPPGNAFFPIIPF